MKSNKVIYDNLLERTKAGGADILTSRKKLKIAFVVGIFPIVSETFIINQIADLLDRGMEVKIFAFKKGSLENVSQRYHDHHMDRLVSYLNFPEFKPVRIIKAIPLFLKILFYQPSVLKKIFDFKIHKNDAKSLKLLYWCAPFIKTDFDLIHCHFGRIAVKFLKIKDSLKLKTPLIVSFYGYDVSLLLKENPRYYDRLQNEARMFFVMSENMKQRILLYGFDPKKVQVLPVSIDVSDYPFKERHYNQKEIFKILSVGRFVEKKGFDDLLKAIDLIRKKTKRPFICDIIGGGELEQELIKLRSDLKLEGLVNFLGYKKIEDIINLFLNYHVFVQPSKTAKNGDME